jgi:hypothetical protein
MKWKQPHRINVRLHYEDGTYEDFKEDYLASDEPQLLRMKPRRQRAPGYKLEIWDDDNNSLDCCEWYGLTFVVGIKRKLPVRQSKTL